MSCESWFHLSCLKLQYYCHQFSFFFLGGGRGVGGGGEGGGLNICSHKVTFYLWSFSFPQKCLTVLSTISTTTSKLEAPQTTMQNNSSVKPNTRCHVPAFPRELLKVLVLNELHWMINGKISHHTLNQKIQGRIYTI